MSEALNMTNRDVFFSLCDGVDDDVPNWASKIGGGSWRISYDIEDKWSSMVTNLKVLIAKTNP